MIAPPGTPRPLGATERLGTRDAAGCLNGDELRAAARLIAQVRARHDARLIRAALFGSKARGDSDEHSDVDLLLVCDIPSERREIVGRANAALARSVEAESGVCVEPWTVSADDLRRGRRTPMLVDAVADSVPLWPRGAPPLRAPFTPRDAVYCADRLLDWVDDGGAIAARALREGRAADAAARARDDIARMATAALLLTGDTRHRRVGSLRKFERRFIRSGLVPLGARASLRWAEQAYPRDGGRGMEHPPVPAWAAATARLGCELAAGLEDAVLPLIFQRMAELEQAT